MNSSISSTTAVKDFIFLFKYLVNRFYNKPIFVENPDNNKNEKLKKYETDEHRFEKVTKIHKIKNR